MKAYAVAILACSFIEGCTPQQWVYQGREDDRRTQVFVDSSSIRVVGEIRRASRTAIYPAHTVNGQGKFSNKWVSTYYFRDEYNCTEKRVKVELIKIYYEDGASSKTPSGSPPAEWRSIEANKASESAMKFVCSWKSI